ncbi:MAG: peptidoglycan DD-metalloendopeptidase family protein [Micromonosporaceae bacterium]|nr:peptidoglycan DD-metalloendopeptidase family protein [Micromonosporaceae bacterium]
MKRSSAVLLVAGGVVVGVAVAMVVVPGFGPRSVVNRVIEAFGGVTCDDEQCPPDAGWMWPVEAPVTSAFRSAERPEHHGVDMAADRGSPVLAASAGVVITAECEASLQGEPYGCDRDGSTEVRGCGWYVKVLHAHHTATLYCHLQQEPEVSVGDTVVTGELLGYVGSTGNSSEPHLHFEVQTGSTFDPPRSATAVDPVQFLAERRTP